MPSLGNGLLQPNFVEKLRNPKLYNYIISYGDRSEEDIPDEEDVAFDGPLVLEADTTEGSESEDAPIRDPEIFQEQELPDFDDSKDEPVFKGDIFIIRKLFFCRLIAPVLRSREEKRLFDQDQGWKCKLCVLLRGFKPGSQTVFKSRALLRKHQSQVHSPWDDLPITMFTETEGILKCPCESCTFTSDSVQEVRLHCLEDCRDRTTFQSIKTACVRTRRKGIDEQTRRELARKLKEGYKLSPRTLSLFNELKAASQSDIEILAETFNANDEALPYRFQVLQACIKMAESAFDFTDGTLTDKNAEDPVDSIHARLITGQFLRNLDEQLKDIDTDVQLDSQWLIPKEEWLIPPS